MIMVEGCNCTGTRIIGFFALFLCLTIMTGILLIFPKTEVLIAENGPVINKEIIQLDQASHSGEALFQELLQAEDDQVGLAHVSLRLAQEEYPEMKIEKYLECIKK